MLKLVVSQTIPHNNAHTPTPPISLPIQYEDFSLKVNNQGPNIFIITAQDPSHYLECQLVIETEEHPNDDLKANVICHFPLISDIDFIHSIDGDETLYDMIMTQFYMKVFNGLLLFCRSHYASHLLIYMDDPTVGNRAGFNNFLMSKRHIEPLQHNAHEQYVPINQQLYDDWQEYMLDTDLKFKQLLWQRQRSSASIKNYLHDHPFG